MKNIFKLSIVLLMMIVSTCFAVDKGRKIAVIVPMQHRAMDEIVRGIRDTLKDSIDNDKIVVFNAMGDTNNMHTIINQIGHNPEYEAIMPIGTNATYLALAATQDKPIVSLASVIDENARQKLIIDGHKNITSVYDEITADDILKFISGIKKHNLLLVFSNDERIIQEVRKIEEIKDRYNVTIHKFNISNATDIYGISAAISNIDCIVLLKDHLVVSMVNVITSIAHEANIPVIASDEGSTINGADIGFGVAEYEIGVVGAQILKEVINGKKSVDIPVRALKDINVFYNINGKIHLDDAIFRNLGYKLKAVEAIAHNKDHSLTD
jgi:putative ABC transport system substrate-binding protein